jgi:hypothetical protein
MRAHHCAREPVRGRGFRRRKVVVDARAELANANRLQVIRAIRVRFDARSDGFSRMCKKKFEPAFCRCDACFCASTAAQKRRAICPANFVTKS